MRPVQIGIVGCGSISDIYLQNLTTMPGTTVAACADLIPERAQARAADYRVPRASTIESLLADPSIDLVVNLTTPRAHFEVALAAIGAGKSVYNEKPLTIELDEAKQLLEAAEQCRVRVGCAPDTFLGAGLQTCRKLIDDGAIGTPVAATAMMLNHGHESWHPDPGFYYQRGGGPMFDMGPYYLTALVSLLGPVRRVTGSARMSFAERVVTSSPRYGETISVETPTHISGVLDFASGPIATIVTSFDVWASANTVEIYGTDGTLGVPDPNGFSGPVRLRRSDADGWEEVPLSHGYAANSRGVGPADLALGMRQNRPHRASGELAYHVLEIMHAVHSASATDRHVDIASTVDRPEPMPALAAVSAGIDKPRRRRVRPASTR